MNSYNSSTGSSGHTGVSYFSKSPFRANHMLGNHLLLLVVLLYLVAMLAKYWHLLPLLSICALAFAGFGVLSFWYRLVRVHLDIHKRISSGNLAVPPPESDADKAFGTIAALIFQALLMSLSMFLLFLIALGAVLQTHSVH